MNVVETFIHDRGLAYNTAKNYRVIVKKYENYNGLSMDELIEEADREEDKGVRWKRRTIKTRLIGFRTDLINKNISENTITTYVNGIKAIYRYFEIELRPLPAIGKQTFKYQELSFEDFLTKEEIKSAYDYADMITRAMLLFMASSGVSKYDTCYKITIGQFIEGCKDYITTDSEDIDVILHNLAKRDDIIPTLYLERQKTKKWFYTFCTPEATSEIIRYLIVKRENLTREDRLFKIHDETLGMKLSAINDALGLGNKGAYRKLRSHMLRKYHASTLLNTKNFTEEEVDAIQGRSKDKIRRSYFRNDPKILKQQYIKSIPDLTIVDTIKYEYLNLKNEKESLDKKLDNQDYYIQEILEVQKEMQKLME